MSTPGSQIETFDNDPHVQQTLQNMADAGEATETRRIVDYWSFSSIERFFLPGQTGVADEHRQYIEFKRMTEADKAEFQTKTNRDIRVQSATKDIKLNMNPALERAELLKISIVGWNLFKYNDSRKRWETYPYDLRNRDAFLRQADPKLVQDLEMAIRDANPWMKNEATPEEIRAAIADLQVQLDEAEQRELEK